MLLRCVRLLMFGVPDLFSWDGEHSFRATVEVDELQFVQQQDDSRITDSHKCSS